MATGRLSPSDKDAVMITYGRLGLLSQYGACLLLLLGLVGLLLLLGCNGGKDTAPGTPQTTVPDLSALDTRVFPPDALPFGKGYDEWSAEWWQWVFSIPASVNPLLDRACRRTHAQQIQWVVWN